MSEFKLFGVLQGQILGLKLLWAEVTDKRSPYETTVGTLVSKDNLFAS